MMLYRSLVLGMLGAIALLVAGQPRALPAETAVPVMVAEAAADVPPESVALVDVSRRSVPHDADLMPFLGLTPGERIVGIGSIAATSADLATRWKDTTVESYLDITVRGPRGERRILVLAHP